MAVEELLTGPGATVASRRRAARRGRPPAPAPGTGSAYVRLEYRRQMEIAVVGATAVVTLADGEVSARASRSPPWHRPSAASLPPRRRSTGSAPDQASVEAAAPCRGGGIRPDLRRARIRALSPRDGGGDRQARDRDRPRARRGGDVPIPASAVASEDRGNPHGQRGAPTPSSSSRGRASSPPSATSWGSPARRRAATTRSAARA